MEIPLAVVIPDPYITVEAYGEHRNWIAIFRFARSAANTYWVE
jgi:hypothetical protein